MAVHDQFQLLLNMLASTPAINTMTPEEARALMAAFSASTSSSAVIASKRDLKVPGPHSEITIRVYKPVAQGRTPIMIYLHGGGFVLGNLDTHDAYCQELCARTGMTVVGVDYKLAPENKFPAGLDDCLAAVRWLRQNASQIDGEPERIILAGDSAGANLSAAITLLLRDAGENILKGQLLIYPVVQHYVDPSPSIKENGEGYLLTEKNLIWFWDHYLNSAAEHSDARVAPIHAKSFVGLPQAFILTAQYDPLRDEGEAFAQKLKDAGVITKFKRYDGAIHGFVTFVDFELGKEAMADICAWLKDLLGDDK